MAKEALNHKACVDLLMQEFGIPKSHRQEVLDEVMHIHDDVRMPHFAIIRSVRGFQQLNATHKLEGIIRKHKTHEGLHMKGSSEYRPGKKRGPLIEPSYENQ